MSIFTLHLRKIGSCSFILLLSCLSPVISLAANIQFKAAPNQVKLRETVSITLDYSDIVIPSQLEVRLTGEKFEWFGGHRVSLNQESGSIRLPLRVDIPLTYKGPLNFVAQLIEAGGTPAPHSFRSQAVSISPDPTNAVGVICAPKQVARTQSFTINAWYSLKKARPIDVHIDVLNQASKQWYAGAIVPMEDQQGQVSATLIMPQEAQGELLWKIFSTPRGEPFPNFLAESGILIPLGQTVIDDCIKLASTGQTPSLKPVDNIIFIGKPDQLIKDSEAIFTVHYDLVSMENGALTLSLLNSATQEYFGGQTIEINRSSHDAKFKFTVPGHAQGPLYVIAYMTPKGARWENSTAEDRIYTLELQ